MRPAEEIEAQNMIMFIRKAIFQGLHFNLGGQQPSRDFFLRSPTNLDEPYLATDDHESTPFDNCFGWQAAGEFKRIQIIRDKGNQFQGGWWRRTLQCCAGKQNSVSMRK
jgi:hypothetical protein